MTPVGLDHDARAARAGAGLPDDPLPTPATSGRHSRQAVSPAVVALLVVAIALTAALLGIAAHQYRKQVMEEAESRSVAIARVLEEHAARTLGIHAASLLRVEWMVDDLGWNRVDDSPLLFERLKAMSGSAPEVQSYWITDETGRVRASSYEWPIRPLSAADREYFQVHRLGGDRIHIGTRLTGKILPEAFFTLSRRMTYANGTFQGVAQVSLLPSYFADFYRSVLHDSHDVILLMREDGTVLVREPLDGDRNTVDIGHYPNLIAAADDNGVFRAVTPFDGVERVMARRKVPDLPIYVLYGTDLRSIEAAWRDRVQPYVLFAAPAAALLILLGLIALRRSRQAVEAQEALHRANEALEDRIAERTRHLDQALTDKEVLLRDIHHRVKNNLQVILSLLELQAQRAPELEGPFSEALSRINTMGLIHEQIYRSTGVSVVRLDEFIEALAGHLRSFHRRPGRDIAIQHRVEPLSLDLNRVVPFALILNEVVSNAFKHAFADRASGTVTIALIEEGSVLHLTVQDDGTGSAEPIPAAGGTGRPSMGMDLIRAFTRQIRGDYRFTRDGGTRFDLTFPKDADPE
ncbi:histidine kinase dimerization/phosphoacceptor domain -containing protein [Azospirillum sp. TSO35-2]|uniref:sensor histidine kinase n=1 Tax=Azospirillum sp. TSO35-2 TaxID=716796 RepID=UPI000D621EE0|nr:histidine kinase dimerization/phosphoacceptor domain -containing protein [Azospirillum sp. TSO35-2]PWC32518.1 histidine kinase [Azospirillum sp. TSO35-2]